MVELYISPTEMQFGMRNGWVDQQNLTLNIGANDIIMEWVYANYGAQTSFYKRLNADLNPIVFRIGDNAWADYFLYGGTSSFIASFYQERLYRQGGAINDWFNVTNIFSNTFHSWWIIRSTTYLNFINGHFIHGPVAKAAHNVNAQRILFPATALYGGVTCPGVWCLVRIYAGDLSIFTNDQLLAIHRKYLRTPFVTPPELLPYERFRWIGRQADGSQILASATTIQNCAPGAPGFGETLLIQGGLNWGQIRAPIWVPR